MKLHRLLLPTLGGLALAAVLLSAAVRQSQATRERNPSPLSLVPRSAPTTRQTDSS